MRITVTGGAGFIGANLCRTLIMSGVASEVTVLDNLSTGSAANLEGLEGVVLYRGSMLDADVLDVAVDGADAIVHLGARPSVPKSIQDPMATHLANVTGTMQVLEAARRAGGPQVIVASSSSVYGSNPHLPKHEGLVPQPVSPYAVSKLATEAYTIAYAHSFDLPVLPFRFFNVFGPLQPAGHAYAAVIPAFVSSAVEGRPVPINGDGTQTRDFTYVGSVCTVITEAIRRQVTSPAPVNLAFGSRRSLLDVIDTLEDLFDRPLQREHHPPRVGDVPHSQADQSALRRLFPDIEPVAFEEGLQATVDWYRSTVREPALQ